MAAKSQLLAAFAHGLRWTEPGNGGRNWDQKFEENGDFIGFNDDLMGSNCDLMVFNDDLLGLNRIPWKYSMEA